MSIRDRYLLQSTTSLLSNLLLFLNSMYAAGIITQKLTFDSPPANLQALSLRFNYIYNFAPFFLRDSFSLSLRSRLRILPLGLFGIALINSIPPVIHLYRALCSSTCFWICRASTRSLSSTPTEGDLTTKAFGTSPDFSSGTWMTAQSLTAGWVRRCASSSAGATWWP